VGSHVGGAKLTRWNPGSGELLEVIPPGTEYLVMRLRRPHLTDLYVTSARKEMDAGSLANYPLSGGLFRIRTNFQGLPTCAFAR